MQDTTVLSDELALNCTMGLYVSFGDCPLLFFSMLLQSEAFRMRQWCLHSCVKDSGAYACLDLSSSFLSCGACNLMKKYSVRTGMYSSLTPEKPVILAPSFCLAKASR